jgi:hypothetical protein
VATAAHAASEIVAEYALEEKELDAAAVEVRWVGLGWGYRLSPPSRC